jgi:hypothetical protein
MKNYPNGMFEKDVRELFLFLLIEVGVNNVENWGMDSLKGCCLVVLLQPPSRNGL